MSRWSPHHSTLLSLLLDDVTGDEEAVGIRQDKCRLQDIFVPLPAYLTGSRAEGLSLPGSDVDIMFDINNYYNYNIKVIQPLHEFSDTSFYNVFLFRAQEPKAPVTYCDHALSGVRPSVRRPSVVRRPLDYLHFRLLLQNRLMDLDETWYG